VITCHEAAKLLIAALDRKREISKYFSAGVEIVAFHATGCKPGICVCGGTRQKMEVNDALEALRKAVS
jgi:hypothetical protein